MTPVGEVRGLTRRLGGRLVLDRLDLSLGEGEFVALLGRSGSGKSTLLRALAGLDPAEEGQIHLPPRRAVAFQEPRLLPWKTVLQNVALGLRGGEAERQALSALAEVGLSERAASWPATLSGGEAQRAALARALVRQPQLLLLDEPFAALDALTRAQMHGLVARLWQRHRPAVLLVTHDVQEAVLLADRVLVLEGGRIGYARPIAAPHPRRRGGLVLTEIEANLLARLGVAS
jgi:sulfonate transport system ATP-binding protein